MEVILLERINKLGNVGEFVKVRPGYARNYLMYVLWLDMQLLSLLQSYLVQLV